jgi:hypothetical protein
MLLDVALDPSPASAEEKTKTYMRPTRIQSFAPILIAFSFLLVMLIFSPFRGSFEMDSDEGINVMKAMLVLKGYDLYGEIWSDQPPLFTFLLAGVFKIAGMEVNAARLTVLVLSTLLLYGAARFLQLSLGAWQAAMGVVLITLIRNYPSLSTAAMVGLPAISLAVLALSCLAAWHRRRKFFWLILSGSMMSLSILTKGFTGFLAPVFLAGILIDGYFSAPAPRSWYMVIRPALIWGASFTILSAVLALVFVGIENFWQLVLPHIDASNTFYYRHLSEHKTINYYLRQSWSIFALGLVGIFAAILTRKWIFLYPSAWVGIGYALLSQHAPVRYHHQLLITIPAAILGALTISEAIRFAPRLWRKGRLHFPRLALLGLSIAGLGWVVVTRVPEKLEAFRARIFYVEPTNKEVDELWHIVREMGEHRAETTWVYTDKPMIAFRAGFPVIPELAVVTEKRWITGEIGEKEIMEGIKAWEPDQVLIGRFELPSVEDYLSRHYDLISTSADMLLFLK